MSFKSDTKVKIVRREKSKLTSEREKIVRLVGLRFDTFFHPNRTFQ